MRWLCAFVLLLLSSCASAPEYQTVRTDEERASAALYRVQGPVYYGSGVAVGPHTILTASHVASSYLMFLVWAHYFVYGEIQAPGRLQELDPFDHYAAVLRIEEVLGTWMPMGVPHDGPALVVCMDGRHDVTLVVADERFDGWRPFPGSSGSPIVQDGQVVALVKSRSAFSQKPAGWYARLTR